MPAVTVVVGDEELLVDRAVSRAVAAAGGQPIGSTRVAAAELDAGAWSVLVSPSLFADQRVIVVEAAQDAGKDVTEMLTSYAQSPEPDVVVVVVHSGTRGRPALDALVKVPGVTRVDVARVRTSREREQFAVEEIRAAGGQLDRDAASALVAAIGSDLREIAIGCEQLHADVGRRIDVDAVTTYHRGRAEQTGFAVADRAVEGDVPAALETLRWAFATGVDPILVNAALASNLRLLGQVASAGRRSPDSLAGPLGIPAWKIRRAQTWVKAWRPPALAAAVLAVAAADAELKGAGDDAAYAVERAVLAVAEQAAA